MNATVNAVNPNISRFVDVKTLHVASVQWWWDDAHNTEYNSKVNVAVRAAIKEAVNRHPTVSEDTRFCCQWEGVQLDGPDLAEVTAAANEVARALSRFKGVISVNL